MPASGDLVTALSAPIAAPRCSASSTPSARRAASRRRAMSAQLVARGAGPRRRHGRAALLRARHARRLDARRPRRRPPATSRAGATGSSARRSPGRQQPLDTPDTPRRALAGQPRAPRDHPRPRFRDVGDRRHARARPTARRQPRRHRRPRLRLPHRVAYAAAMALSDIVRAHGAQIAAERPLGAHRPRRARSARPRRSSGARPPAPLPGGSSCRRRRLPPSRSTRSTSARAGSRTLRKRTGCSGYFTVAWALADRCARRRRLDDRRSCARCAPTRSPRRSARRRDHELMALYAQALRDARRASSASAARSTSSTQARGSAQRLAELAGRRHDDVARHRLLQARADRRQRPRARRRRATFDDLDALTIFADNLVPHVLRCEGVLVYDDGLAAHIDAGRLLRPGPQEREIRGCADPRLRAPSPSARA